LKINCNYFNVGDLKLQTDYDEIKLKKIDYDVMITKNVTKFFHLLQLQIAGKLFSKAIQSNIDLTD